MLKAFIDYFHSDIDITQFKNLSIYKPAKDLEQLSYYMLMNTPTSFVADAERKKLCLVEIINEISQLEENWDGYGALKISQSVIRNTLLIIESIRLFPQFLDPSITPLANGTISLEWETNQGVAYLEIGSHRFSGYIKSDNQKPALIQGQANSLSFYTLSCIHSILFSREILQPYNGS